MSLAYLQPRYSPEWYRLGLGGVELGVVAFPSMDHRAGGGRVLRTRAVERPAVEPGLVKEGGEDVMTLQGGKELVESLGRTVPPTGVEGW